MKKELIFQIAAVALIAAAAYFLYTGNSDRMFACLVLSACAFFLSVRFQMKHRNDEREDVARRVDGNDDTSQP